MTKIIIGREYPDFITNLIKNSKSSIKILIYDWRWYSHDPHTRIQKFNNEVLAAIRRGVDVSAVVNSNVIADVLQQFGVKIKICNSSKVMHIKMIIVDEKYLVLGSHNLSMNAFELNHEMSVLLEDVESINRCSQFFNEIAI